MDVTTAEGLFEITTSIKVLIERKRRSFNEEMPTYLLLTRVARVNKVLIGVF